MGTNPGGVSSRGGHRARVELRGPSGLRPVETVTVTLDGETEEDLLLGLLDEVIYLLDTTGRVPVTVQVQPARTGLRALLGLVDLAAGTVVGAAPKAITLHWLVFEAEPDGWHCGVTVDV